MKSSLDNHCLTTDERGENVAEISAKSEFRHQFKRALLQCVKHGFSIEECFGTVWEEVLDEVCPPETAQSQLYDELIAWAKKRVG